MEAVGEKGVRLVPWLGARIFVGNFFNKVGYRRLQFNMARENLEALDRFRRNVTGKQYGLNLKKLLTTTSEAVSYARQGEINQDRQFFCSELVAKAFKVIGVLRNTEKSST
mmetsp:Transcript_7461/g.11644  ORF Transcript_7461/g.11644 Transcript_7461/m.11644 type:complete len:111 (-) Transcript_7461:182-514(-)